MADTCPITRVHRDDQWFQQLNEKRWAGLCFHWRFILGRRSPDAQGNSTECDAALIKFIHELYNLRIGEIACKWRDDFTAEYQERIKYRHAKIKLGDIFDFYTTADGVLQVPQWTSFQYAVEEYLENDPRIK